MSSTRDFCDDAPEGSDEYIPNPWKKIAALHTEVERLRDQLSNTDEAMKHLPNGADVYALQKRAEAAESLLSELSAEMDGNACVWRSTPVMDRIRNYLATKETRK